MDNSHKNSIDTRHLVEQSLRPRPNRIKRPRIKFGPTQTSSDYSIVKEIWFKLHKRKPSHLGIASYIYRNNQKRHNREVRMKKEKQATKQNVSKTKQEWALMEHTTAMNGLVMYASKCVEDEILSGKWPTLYYLEDQDFNDKNESHLQTVAYSIKQFSQDVISPAMQASNTNMSEPIRVASDLEPLSRYMIAVFLSLREVLTQNAVRIFYSTSIYDNSMNSLFNGNHQAYKEFELYHSQLLATSVIVGAIARCTETKADDATDLFLETAAAYDSGKAEFLSCLEGTDLGAKECILATGKRFKNEQMTARALHFDLAKEMHPMVVRRVEQKLKIPPEQLVRIPEANACHFSIIKKQKGQTESD